MLRSSYLTVAFFIVFSHVHVLYNNYKGLLCLVVLTYHSTANFPTLNANRNNASDPVIRVLSIIHFGGKIGCVNSFWEGS